MQKALKHRTLGLFGFWARADAESAYSFAASQDALSFLVLSGTKQDFFGLVVLDGLSEVSQDLNAALNSGSFLNQIKPSFELWVVGPINALVLPAPEPRVDGNVCD